MKWKFYGNWAFWSEFIILLALMTLFLIDIFWLHYSKVNENTSVVDNILNCSLLIILLRFTLTEIVEMSYSVKNYF